MNKNLIILLTVVLAAGGGLGLMSQTQKSASVPEVKSAADAPPASAPVTTDATADSVDMDAAGESTGFVGEKGETLLLENGQVSLTSTSLETNKVKFYNTTLPDGKTVYYLILKDSEGNIRAAANANRQCAQYGKGYRQEGDELICLTCLKKYPLKDFAVEKPDCNPYPINAKLPQAGGSVTLTQAELESVASLF